MRWNAALKWRVRRVVGTTTRDDRRRIRSPDAKSARGLHAPMLQGRKPPRPPGRACRGTGMCPTCSSCDADRSKTRSPRIGYPCRCPLLGAPGNRHSECSRRQPRVRVVHAVTEPHERTRPRRACSTRARPLRNTEEHAFAPTQSNRPPLRGAMTWASASCGAQVVESQLLGFRLKTFVFRNGASNSLLRQAGPHRYLLVTQPAQREPANGYALHVAR
jgi:hypothetical protein